MIAQNKRITLQQKTKTPDGQGGNTEAWSDLVTVWASIKTPKSQANWNREQAAEQSRQNTEYEFNIRYRNGVTDELRVKYGTRIFTIQSVIDVDERHREINLYCSEE
ncbi:hypothetical protein JCM15765_14750 [Paradesulfitobacterium aromaticivorans]